MYNTVMEKELNKYEKFILCDSIGWEYHSGADTASSKEIIQLKPWVSTSDAIRLLNDWRKLHKESSIYTITSGLENYFSVGVIDSENYEGNGTANTLPLAACKAILNYKMEKQYLLWSSVKCEAK